MSGGIASIDSQGRFASLGQFDERNSPPVGVVGAFLKKTTRFNSGASILFWSSPHPQFGYLIVQHQGDSGNIELEVK